MSAVHPSILISDVTRVNRPGVGPVYRGVITFEQLFDLLNDATVRYSPRYQRGFKNPDTVSEREYDRLLPIMDDKLQLNPARAHAMAVKFLMALNGVGAKRLFTSHVTWNARRERNRPEPFYDPRKRRLELRRSVLTIPDTGHRHLGYYTLVAWKKNPDEIPDVVEIESGGERATASEIRKWLQKFDPSDPETSSLHVEIFNIEKEEEGWLYDEFNEDARPPARATAIDLNPKKTPSRRFVYALIARSRVFSRDEIETRSNTISVRSRKLTTNATLEAAIRPFSRRLFELEKSQTKAYDDLVAFFAAFFEEWARHHKALRPGASADERHAFRRESLALSNIMFFPMFRLAMSLWEKYHADKVDWRREKEWRDALARLAGPVSVPAGKRRSTAKVAVMSRDNPAWQGKILVQKFTSNGRPAGWHLSSTRDTRDAAFHYVCEVAGVVPQPKPARKSPGRLRTRNIPAAHSGRAASSEAAAMH